MSDLPQLPSDFVMGTATAAYQIEGAAAEDGRGPSIWDTFTHEPGKIRNGDTGDVACDHYHRWAGDLDLMRALGLDAYRFSVSWSRVQPDGRGKPNEQGLAFYDRLVDGLCERNIVPALTLYHWDLPQALEDTGGWMQRDTAERFADYASLLAQRLGDRVGMWITLNEPFVQTTFGYAIGMHAPGRTLMADAFPVAHHLLLGHGLAARAVRAAGVSGDVGITNNYSPLRPATQAPEDVEATRRFDVLQNWLFTDPVLLGHYPDRAEDVLSGGLAAVHDGDLDLIANPVDFLGVNYYFPSVVNASDDELGFLMLPAQGDEITSFGWPIVPAGMHETLTSLRARYADALPPIYITENGAAFDDRPDADGAVNDPRRIAFLDSHIRAVLQAREEGVDVRGYFIWSLLDNFEWAEGYSQRFGIVHVDFETQRRTPKASYDWVRQMLAARR